jgi:hypothetical protein
MFDLHKRMMMIRGFSSPPLCALTVSQEQQSKTTFFIIVFTLILTTIDLKKVYLFKEDKSSMLFIFEGL